MIVNDEVIGY